MDRADTSRQTELFNLMKWSNDNSMQFEGKVKQLVSLDTKNIKKGMNKRIKHQQNL
jgi:hypothetical protein